MKTERIKISNEEFLKVELETISQKGNQFFIGKINASDFLKLYTVRPAQYDLKKHSSFAESFGDDKEYYDYLISEDKRRMSEKDFQREYDKSRVNRIAEFLEEKEYPFFPNTIISNCELINDFQGFEISESNSVEDFVITKNRPKHLSFLQSKNGSSVLYIPFVESSVLVIDGQHRLRGLEFVSEKIQQKYELLIAFIIGFDRSVIAQLFYTINYEQKSVNKSLLYHLTGEFSNELDEITFMHNVIKVLNELESSPFHGKIKMLGVNPKNATKEEKEHLTISQAFLIDYLIRTISKSSSNSYFQPIFLYYYQREQLQIEIVRFLIKYFGAIKEIRNNDWDNPSDNILTKGIGIGALTRVLHFLFVRMFIDKWNMQPEEIKNTSKKDLVTMLKGLEEVDFSKTGEFGGVGSGGSINKLSHRIVTALSFFECANYDTFLKEFQSDYLPKFQDWAKSNT